MITNDLKNRILDRAEQNGITIATVTALSTGTALLASYDMISLKRTSADTDYAILPDITTVPMGYTLEIYNVDTCSIRSSDPATVGINGGATAGYALELTGKSHTTVIKVAEDNWQATIVTDDFATVLQTAAS